jgi:hypothetical protein
MERSLSASRRQSRTDTINTTQQAQAAVARAAAPNLILCLASARKGLPGLGLVGGWFRVMAGQRYSGQDQGNTGQYRHGDALAEDQHAEHDRDHRQQVGVTVGAMVAPSLVMIW